MANKFLYLDGMTGLAEYEGNSWPYGVRCEVPAGNSYGNRVHFVKNGGRFFTDSFAGRYAGYWDSYSYINPSAYSPYYPWAQFGCWLKFGNPEAANYIIVPVDWNRIVPTTYWGGSGYASFLSDGELYYYGYSGKYYTVVPNKWFWVETRIYFHNDGAGVAEFRVNEDIISRFTGVSTCSMQAGAPAGEQAFNQATLYFADFYNSTTAPEMDDAYAAFADTEEELPAFGKKTAEPLYVNGDGAEIMATPIGPTSHASVEFPVNDIIYVSATAGERDCYSFSNLESDRTRTIHGVRATARAKRNGGGAATIRCYCRVNGSNYYGDTHYLSPEWREYIHIWAQNPDTSTAWTREDLDVAQFGFERVA